MAYHETSDADLNSYLSDIARADNEREWCKRRADGFWGDSDSRQTDRIVDAWRRISERDPECLFALDIAGAFIGHSDDRVIRAERLLSIIEEKIADEFIIMAGEELDAHASASRYSRMTLNGT